MIKTPLLVSVCRPFEEVPRSQNRDSEIVREDQNPRVGNVYRTQIFTRIRSILNLSKVNLL